jgi:hypothetical protein
VVFSLSLVLTEEPAGDVPAFELEVPTLSCGDALIVVHRYGSNGPFWLLTLSRLGGLVGFGFYGQDKEVNGIQPP